MQTVLDNTERQLENARIEVEKPFEKEAELSEKMERLMELNALLNMDEKDNDAVMLGDDAEGEDGEISGLEEDSEILVAEEKAEIAKESGIGQGSKKPSERSSLKEKLEMMKGKAADYLWKGTKRNRIWKGGNMVLYKAGRNFLDCEIIGMFYDSIWN